MKINVDRVNKMMLGYKETGDELELENILNVVNGVIKNQCLARLNSNVSTLNDYDDFESEAKTYIWEAIMDYKFTCPICGIVSKTEKSYKDHLKEEHGCGTIHNGKKIKTVKFDFPIYFYTIQIMTQKLMNITRKECKLKRLANTNMYKDSLQDTVNNHSSISDDTTTKQDLLKDDIANVEDMIISEDMINEMMKQITKEGKKIQKFVFKGLMVGLQKTDMAEELYKNKVYSSVNSAKSCVSKATKEIREMFIGMAV